MIHSHRVDDAEFHENLVHGLMCGLRKDPSQRLVVTAIDSVISNVPPPSSANTNKEVLLIIEIEKLLELIDEEHFQLVSSKLIHFFVRGASNPSHL